MTSSPGVSGKRDERASLGDALGLGSSIGANESVGGESRRASVPTLRRAEATNVRERRRSKR